MSYRQVVGPLIAAGVADDDVLVIRKRPDVGSSDLKELGRGKPSISFGNRATGLLQLASGRNHSCCPRVGHQHVPISQLSDRNILYMNSLR